MAAESFNLRATMHNIPLRYRRTTEAAVCGVVDLYTEGTSGTDIAKWFNTTPTAVYAALDRLGMPRRPSHNGFLGDCNHDFFNVINTEPKAYFLGAMSGDGCISGVNEIIFSLQHNDIFLQKCPNEWNRATGQTAEVAGRDDHQLPT